jgi:hypothetical protein
LEVSPRVFQGCVTYIYIYSFNLFIFPVHARSLSPDPRRRSWAAWWRTAPQVSLAARRKAPTRKRPSKPPRLARQLLPRFPAFLLRAC